MSRKTVTRREVIQKTTLGVGAIAAAPVLGGRRLEQEARRQAVQVTFTLDSGAFLTYEEDTGYRYSEVGYFSPEIAIYGDGVEIARILPEAIATAGQRIEVHQSRGQRGYRSGITVAASFRDHLLRLSTLYDGAAAAVDRAKFHAIFYFTSGHFCGSMIKNRAFKEAYGKPYELTGERRTVARIAHDIDVHYQLARGEYLLLKLGGRKLWSSADHPGVRRRFDLQVLADNATAELFYRDALRLDPSQTYWLPNQGDPPPVWHHGGGPAPGGGGP